MPIKPSTSRQVDALIADLASEDAVRRDAAVARLSIIGSRAVARLTALAASSADPGGARAAALRALEAIADPAALDVVLRMCDAGDDQIAASAIVAARPFLRSDRGAEVTDRLAALALSTERSETVRVAAVHVLSDLDASTISPLLATLRRDHAVAIAEAATHSEASLAAAVDPEQTLRNAAAGLLPDTADALRRALVQGARAVATTVLKQVVDRVREYEGSQTADGRRGWTAVRGLAHLLLAQRRSRAALYDLRETIDAARGPLPAEFLAAVTEIGDGACLEALAGAYARARTAPSPAWWRGHLADAFRAVAAREKITPRAALIKRIQKKYGDALRGLID